VAVRQGGGREINDGYSKKRKTRVGKCYLDTREWSLPQEVKATNEITCDYVWDAPPPFL
jgi:hypothetical protein